MDEGVNYYIPAAVLAVVLLAKLPALVRGWRVPVVRSVNFTLMLGVVGFTFVAPPTITLVNRLTGISNFSAPLVYIILCVTSCSILVLLENWRADPCHQAATRRRVRRWIAAYALVGVVIIVCFVLGEAPDERLRDFDTYYSSTPFIREMIVSYLVAHSVASAAATVLSVKWAVDIIRKARREPPSTEAACLRVGMVILSLGFSMNLTFGVVKLAGVLSHSERLNEGVNLVISSGAFVTAAGFLIPVFAPRFIERIWRPWRSYRALVPLRRTVRPSESATGQPVFLELPWYAGPEQRLIHRLTGIQDWMLGLRPYYDDEVREQARRLAEERGASGAEATILGLAAMVRGAAANRARGTKAGPAQSARAVAAYREAEAEYGDLAECLSRALLRTPQLADHAPSPAEV
ncbi:DUF6545 domain-containing protein [Streptomyces sp. NPDC051546]|uniref:DUF6545 domain-containing protein n=1 Tax=Streptomyces sp. NPDC051546 TaxID=3365655 RepID=UPI003794BC31